MGYYNRFCHFLTACIRLLATWSGNNKQVSFETCALYVSVWAIFQHNGFSCQVRLQTILNVQICVRAIWAYT